MKQGPNVKRLIIERMSLAAIPPGTGNPLQKGVEFLLDKNRMLNTAKEATAWVELAIATVKTAPDNPYGDDDEAIAGEILRQLRERRTSKR